MKVAPDPRAKASIVWSISWRDIARHRNPCSGSLRLVEDRLGRCWLWTPGMSICRPECDSCMMYFAPKLCTASASFAHNGMNSSRWTVA